jgi:hypothetical protein
MTKAECVDAVLEAASVDHPDLVEVAKGWLSAISDHRRKIGAFGKVGAAMVETPAGVELHLTEETTFKAGTASGTPCPLRAALAWLESRQRDRKRGGSSGSGSLEFDQKGGVVTLAKVHEVTIISRRRLDAARRTQ